MNRQDWNNSYASGEPTIRVICKIATRILVVIGLVGLLTVVLI